MLKYFYILKVIFTKRDKGKFVKRLHKVEIYIKVRFPKVDFT